MSKTKGYIYGCISAATYGLIPLFTLPVMAKGLHFDTILFYRFSIATLSIGIMLLLKHESFKVKRSEIPTLLVMGALFSFSSLFLFWSYNYLAAGIAAVILFLYPVLVTLLMAGFFHEKISWVTLLAISLGLGGIGLLYKGDGTVTLSLVGIGLVFLSSLSYALYIVGVNKTKISYMTGSKLTFYALLTGTVMFFVKLHFGMQLQALPDWQSLVNVSLLAILPTVVSCIAMFYAVRYVGSTATAILGVLEPVTAVVVGVLVFHEALTLSVINGVLLIIASVTLIILSGSILKSFGHIHCLLLRLKQKKR